MYKVDIYITVSPASTRKDKKNYAFVLSCKGVNRDGSGSMEGTYHETTLHAINQALSRLKQSCEVTLHCEDEFVLNMYENNLARWVANNFKTAKGETVLHHEEWRELWRLTRGQKIIPVKGKHAHSKGGKDGLYKRDS